MKYEKSILAAYCRKTANFERNWRFSCAFSTTSILPPCQKFNFNSTRPSLCILLEEDIRQDVGVLLVRLRHDMGIDVGGGADLGMAQPLAYTHAVHTVEIEHRGHCMPESVGVDMGEPVAL